ncbi:LOW QUALITY PROTEIN: zinc finger MYND domain-containing protein 15 [Phalacrocorax carbo]|uniref:LOW QUALITY PROTEIN: zinc finger MYND domain-containing protein 15 n=1 Tax=Phalacrocorax carbo TaxID=9209 RepID=UPI00311996F0
MPMPPQMEFLTGYRAELLELVSLVLGWRRGAAGPPPRPGALRQLPPEPGPWVLHALPNTRLGVALPARGARRGGPCGDPRGPLCGGTALTLPDLSRTLAFVSLEEEEEEEEGGGAPQGNGTPKSWNPKPVPELGWGRAAHGTPHQTPERPRNPPPPSTPKLSPGMNLNFTEGDPKSEPKGPRSPSLGTPNLSPRDPETPLQTPRPIHPRTPPSPPEPPRPIHPRRPPDPPDPPGRVLVVTQVLLLTDARGVPLGFDFELGAPHAPPAPPPTRRALGLLCRAMGCPMAGGPPRRPRQLAVGDASLHAALQPAAARLGVTLVGTPLRGWGPPPALGTPALRSRLCHACGGLARTPLRCPQCRAVLYCSEGCRAAEAVGAHRGWCRQLGGFMGRAAALAELPFAFTELSVLLPHVSLELLFLGGSVPHPGRAALPAAPHGGAGAAPRKPPKTGGPRGVQVGFSTRPGPRPDLVIGFNPGFALKESWLSALPRLQAQRVPAYFAEGGEFGCAAAGAAVAAATGGGAGPPLLNPFRCPLRRRGLDNALPWYANAFIFQLLYKGGAGGPHPPPVAPAAPRPPPAGAPRERRRPPRPPRRR